MKERINEQLELLERELSRMKSVTEYYQETNENSGLILSELKELHQKYASASESLFSLYRRTLDELRADTAGNIADITFKLTEVGDQIELINNKKFEEINKLLESYQKTLDSTDRLVQNLESLDLKNQLQDLDQNSKVKYETLAQYLAELGKSLSIQLVAYDKASINRNESISNALNLKVDAVRDNLSGKLEAIDSELSQRMEANGNLLTQRFKDVKTELLQKLELQEKLLNHYKLFLYTITALTVCGLIIEFIK